MPATDPIKHRVPTCSGMRPGNAKSALCGMARKEHSHSDGQRHLSSGLVTMVREDSIPQEGQWSPEDGAHVRVNEPHDDQRQISDAAHWILASVDYL